MERTEVIDLTTEADIDAALKRAKTLPPETQAVSGEYNRDLDLIILCLDDGRQLVVPREQMRGLQNATEAQFGVPGLKCASG